MQTVIEKENNFKQAGERYRSFAPDRYLTLWCLYKQINVFKWHTLHLFISSFRQERYIRRWVDALSDPRCTHEIRSIWISYWSQVSLFAKCHIVNLYSWTSLYTGVGRVGISLKESCCSDVICWYWQCRQINLWVRNSHLVSMWGQAFEIDANQDVQVGQERHWERINHVEIVCPLKYVLY
jgi:hypothetical protein